MPSFQSHFLDGGGAAADEIRETDWGRTPLGEIDGWPGALKTAISMMVASPFPKSIFWGPEFIMFHNDAYRVIMAAKPRAIGRRLEEVWPEVLDEILPIADRAMRGEATFIKDFPLTVERGNGPESCYFTFSYSPIRDETGQVGGFINTVIETTATVEAEQSLKVQNAELAHRIQNTLAIVASIARQTLRAAPDTEQAWTVLSNRLGALAETHNVLRAGPQASAELGDVVRATLRPYGDGMGDARARFRLSGPAVVVPERQALALSLAVNELATNALKHGALSVEAGHVAVDWRVEGTGEAARLLLRWQEQGGPTVSPPTRKSFGSRLIEQVVPTDFGGTAVLTYAPEGLIYELESSTRWFGAADAPD